VGRLDLDTEGALLLTNDGELAQKILHPSHEVNKTYEAEVQGRPDRKKLTSLSRGIMLEGRKTWPAEVEIVKTASRSTTIRITIHEGRKRQVRKMFDVIGHPVLKLKRTAYGRLRLGNLEAGKYRYLSKAEIKFIFKK
jgi:pseudouridine synthase